MAALPLDPNRMIAPNDPTGVYQPGQVVTVRQEAGPPCCAAQQRAYFMERRRLLIIELGALEDLLGLPRSVVPRRKR